MKPAKRKRNVLYHGNISGCKNESKKESDKPEKFPIVCGIVYVIKGVRLKSRNFMHSLRIEARISPRSRFGSIQTIHGRVFRENS